MNHTPTCLVTSSSSCGIVTVCYTKFRQTVSDKGQAQANTDVRTRAEHRMTTTHRLHDTGRHQRALSILTRQRPQPTTVVTLKACACAHPTTESQFRYQAGHHKGRRNFIHCRPLLKEFLCETDHRNDTTHKTSQARFTREVPCFIHCSKAARCNIFAIVSVSRVCQIFEQHRSPSQVSRNGRSH